MYIFIRYFNTISVSIIEFPQLLNLDADGSSLTDKPSSGSTVPVIPVVDTVSEYILILEESETILGPEVIGLVPHPVIPSNICPLPSAWDTSCFSKLFFWGPVPSSMSTSQPSWEAQIASASALVTLSSRPDNKMHSISPSMSLTLQPSGQ